MTNNSKLYYLIDLIDDDSDEVRSEILNTLGKYGANLELDLLEFKDIINQKKYELLMPVIESNRKNWLLSKWPSRLKYEDPFDKIEFVLDLISKYQYGIYEFLDLSFILDDLAEEFKNKIPYGDELDLSYFLFQEIGIKGAGDDYYNPFNSNAIYALKEKKGLPITLCLIYILIANRLGLDVFACNFPGHFLTRINSFDERLFIDCYNGGKILYENDIKKLAGESYDAFVDIINSDTNPEAVAGRILRNLINSYSILNDIDRITFFQKLLDSTHP
jgi:hypothetical protein